MADDARKGGWWGVVLALMLLPVVYVLSAGPAVYVAERTSKGWDAVEWVYAPLEWLCRNTPLKKPVVWYVGLWEK